MERSEIKRRLSGSKSSERGKRTLGVSDPYIKLFMRDVTGPLRKLSSLLTKDRCRNPEVWAVRYCAGDSRERRSKKSTYRGEPPWTA